RGCGRPSVACLLPLGERRGTPVDDRCDEDREAAIHDGLLKGAHRESPSSPLRRRVPSTWMPFEVGTSRTTGLEMRLRITETRIAKTTTANGPISTDASV